MNIDEFAKGDKNKDRSKPSQRPPIPNTIGNAPDISSAARKFDFTGGRHEEFKRNAPLLDTKSITMAQFMRNVHSKQDLLYALNVKGKQSLSI